MQDEDRFLQLSSTLRDFYHFTEGNMAARLNPVFKVYTEVVK